MPGPMYPDLNPEELEEEGYRSEFERVLLTAEELPVIFSQIYLQHKVEKRRWDRTFILLKESRIYMSSKVRVVAKFLRAWRESTTAAYKQLMGEDAVIVSYIKVIIIFRSLQADSGFRRGAVSGD
uniref:Uncharacterized protein n=1 Tax=Lygus hesperus TaxID=30085 RepID=A0A0K8SU90_LYGHE